MLPNIHCEWRDGALKRYLVGETEPQTPNWKIVGLLDEILFFLHP